MPAEHNSTAPRLADSAEIAQHRHAVRLNARDASAHALLGIALLRERRIEEGVAALRRAIALNGKIRGIHAILAAALFDMADYPGAADCYRQALRFQDSADLHLGLSDALLRMGQPVEAEASARRAVEGEPAAVSAHLSLAAALHAQGRMADGCDALRRVLELDPNQHDARYDLGQLLFNQQKYEEAQACLAQVVAHVPGHMEARRRLGLCLRALSRADDAAAVFELALAATPDDVSLMAELGASYQLLGRLPEATAVLERALALEPDNTMALRAMTHTRFTLGEWQGALATTRHLMKVHPTPEFHSMLLFVLSHCCQDPDELTREHFAFGERWEAPLRAGRQPHANDRDPERVLRIGLVSADLYHHALARFLMPVLEVMKASTQVQFYVYYNNTVQDDVTKVLRAGAAAWREIAHLDDAAAEQLIRADAIDILIDLNGHSASNRLPLFARKPAPVQATWMGYAGTTGLEAIDYILCDRFMVPGTRYDSQFTERIVKLPLGAPFQPQPVAPPINDLPALRNGYLTFGSFHRASKLGRDVIAQWAQLLHAIPDAKMLLGGLQSGIDDVLVDWFALEGIGPERLLLRPRSKMYDYLQQHHEVDICLSPFPYSGGTTIGHALWMGVPTLATIGPTNPSAAAAVFMVHLGLDTFITDSVDTYVKLGVFLSQNVPALAAMRGTMRQRFMKSILGYPGITGAAVELALRRMWQRWCAGQETAPLAVTMAELAEQGAQQAE